MSLGVFIWTVAMDGYTCGPVSTCCAGTLLFLPTDEGTGVRARGGGLYKKKCFAYEEGTHAGDSTGWMRIGVDSLQGSKHNQVVLRGMFRPELGMQQYLPAKQPS